MRYEDWDILLFPGHYEVPIREFKVACHVVYDAEFSHGHGSFGLPTLCCFVPSLPTGAPFRISIHSWSDPIVSQFTRSYSKFVESVTFEARVFVDGRLVASTPLERDQKLPGPSVIAHSFDFSKNGDLEPLKFPAFRQELLQQNYWSPADDLGRIKIVISEGFPRDSLSMPIERVKNVVAFSFQHAPLEILEGSSIAWPNSSMWRRAPFTSSMPVPSYSSGELDSHAHSPRRRTAGVQQGSSGYPPPMIQGFGSCASDTRAMVRASLAGCSNVSNPPSAASNLFGDTNAYVDWLNGMETGGIEQGNPTTNGNARKNNTDTSMPDYEPFGAGNPNAASCGNQSFGLNFRPDEDSLLAQLKVPTNTPTAVGHGKCELEGVPFPLLPNNSMIPSDLANSLTSSLLNQPMPFQSRTIKTPVAAQEIRSRKENRALHRSDPSPSTISSESISGREHHEMRKVSQEIHVAPISTVSPDAVMSHGNSPSSQRIPSLGDFGTDITNTTSSDTALRVSAGITPDKDIRRVRNFTPASVKAIDEEDEPRKASPRPRLSPFMEDGKDGLPV